MATEQEMLTEIKGLKDALEKGAAPASKVGTPQQVFGGFGQAKDNAWPVAHLERLSKSYNHYDVERLLMRTATKSPRASGHGPMLCRMVGIDNPKLAKDPNYGLEQLKREYGVVTVNEYAEQGMKMPNGEIRKTALAEGSGMTGGYVVPPDFHSTLLTIAGEDEFIEPRAFILPMTSRTATMPMLDITTAQSTGTTPYYGGVLASWQPEAASINETEPQFRMGEWTAYDLMLYAVCSNQLLADNGIGLDVWLTKLFSGAITFYKTYAWLRGLGAGNSMPLGILNAPATHLYTRAASNTFTMADAAGMMARLQIRSWNNACWIMHQSVLPQLIQMLGNSGTSANLAWLNPWNPSGPGGPLTSKLPMVFLNGLPIFFTECLPTLGTLGDVILADLSHYVIGNRMELQIDVSSHYLFKNNQMAWRVISRCDGKPWLNNKITDSQGYVISPFVALQAFGA